MIQPDDGLPIMSIILLDETEEKTLFLQKGGRGPCFLNKN